MNDAKRKKILDEARGNFTFLKREFFLSLEFTDEDEGVLLQFFFNTKGEFSYAQVGFSKTEYFKVCSEEAFGLMVDGLVEEGKEVSDAHEEITTKWVTDLYLDEIRNIPYDKIEEQAKVIFEELESLVKFDMSL